MYKALPQSDPAKGFDVVVEKEVRFILEPVPQHPLDNALAFEALDQLYGLVLNGMAREVGCLVGCNGVALGRFRVLFL